MTAPTAPTLWCHGLDCTWSGTADELVRPDTSKPPACPSCGSFTPNKKRREAAKPPIGEPRDQLPLGAAPAALAEAAARIDQPRPEPAGVKVDSVAEEYEAAVIALAQAERALRAAQSRAQAALVAVNQGILARAGLA